ncbi:hypothetical protein PUN28_018280 [Cardiocondyla obscurior]|uniref:Transmembrane protein n=1 Tax=Cardiocondyla obscurior TaxID=286306 RepID=A0AAW2EHP6_9HYME
MVRNVEIVFRWLLKKTDTSLYFSRGSEHLRFLLHLFPPRLLQPLRKMMACYIASSHSSLPPLFPSLSLFLQTALSLIFFSLSLCLSLSLSHSLLLSSCFSSQPDPVDSRDARRRLHARSRPVFLLSRESCSSSRPALSSLSSSLPVSRDPFIRPAHLFRGQRALSRPRNESGGRRRTSGAFEQIENTRRIRLITET